MSSFLSVPKDSRLLGATLLVAGCCIGAGMLGLPVLAADAGLIPSLCLFVLAWLFMLTSGLLLLEVNLNAGEQISLVSLAEKTLGILGKSIAWIGFLFLFYALMVAYSAGSGALISSLVLRLFGLNISQAIGAIFINCIFAFLLYRGIGVIDYVNRYLMIGLFLTYCALILVGWNQVEGTLLQQANWKAALPLMPALVISFGFHNLIPSLVTYLHGNRKKLCISVILGSAIPLVIYLLWQIVILGVVSMQGKEEFIAAADSGSIVTQALAKAIGSSCVVDIAQAFAFFALVTSFIAVAQSFIDFLADGLHFKKSSFHKALLCFLVLFPPLVCALRYPTIFLTALTYAGAFGAVVLFALLPIAMVWKSRILFPKYRSLVPGGKGVLILMTVMSFAIMALQVLSDLGWGHG